MIEKREPADYEPLHSAGITYPSYGLRNGLTIHTSFHIIYSFVFPSPMGLLASRERVPIRRARYYSSFIRISSLTLSRKCIVGSRHYCVGFASSLHQKHYMSVRSESIPCYPLPSLLKPFWHLYQFPGIVISKVTSACEEAGGPTLLFILPALIFFFVFFISTYFDSCDLSFSEQASAGSVINDMSRLHLSWYYPACNLYFL